MKINKYKKNYGFTLLEVLVAVAVMGILTVVLSTLLQISLKAWRIGGSQIDTTQNARQAVDRLKADIIGALPAMNGDTINHLFLFQVEKDKMMDTNLANLTTFSSINQPAADKLDIVSLSATTPDDLFDIKKYWFYLGNAKGITTRVDLGNPRQMELDGGTGNNLFLIRNFESTQNIVGSDALPIVRDWSAASFRNYAVPIANNITSIKYTFCETNYTWTDNWTSSKKYLPQLIKIGFTAAPEIVSDLGDPTMIATGISMAATIKLFQNNAPNNWW
ncbi:MAG TPA: type II secretion system protein [bacterium]|nr:type II secretion system protein [bacterium]